MNPLFMNKDMNPNKDPNSSFSFNNPILNTVPHAYSRKKKLDIQCPKIDSITDSLLEKEQINNFTMRGLSSYLLHLNNKGNTEGL